MKDIRTAAAAAFLAITLVQSPPAAFGERAPRAKAFFRLLHDRSESLYDGNGHWGESQSGTRMMLRDSYWRADVYAVLASLNDPQAELYQKRHDEVIDYLLRAQDEGGEGVFPIPADPTNPEFGPDIRRVLDRCPGCDRNHWLVTLPTEAGLPELYYDHGNALVTVSRAYLAGKDPRLLPAITKAADWALDKPLTRNVNYLSALCKGLCAAFEATGDHRYLDKAVNISEEGIFPYQADSGDWDDAHNIQLSYHGFIVSGLVALRSVLPQEHEAGKRLDEVLNKAVRRMAERDLKEDGRFGLTWPGTNLIAWYELSKLRPLTKDESRAVDRVLNLLAGYTPEIRKVQNFKLQKAIYSYFPAGLEPAIQRDGRKKSASADVGKR